MTNVLRDNVQCVVDVCIFFVRLIFYINVSKNNDNNNFVDQMREK